MSGGMSSYKKRSKSVQRTHRERGQPSTRRRLGLLEKHGDYVLRARNYQQKSAHIKNLQEKARNRNPDEFYYKMTSSKLKEGRHVIPQPVEDHTKEELLIMKTQDMKYVQMKLSMEKKKVERLQSGLHFLSDYCGEKRVNSHTIFVDSPDEASTVSKPQEVTATLEAKDECSLSYKELKQRTLRTRELTRVAQKLKTQKDLMTKGKRIRIKGDSTTPTTYRWHRERKR